jgi:phosphoribosylformylglycinamidine synthase subunit PurS
LTASNGRVWVRAQVRVMLKPEIADPQGQTVERALPSLGWDNVSGVRVGKHLELTLEGGSADECERQVAEMCERFLSNPVIETFSVEVEPL